MKKDDLRKHYKRLRLKMSEDKRNEKSKKIAERLFNLTAYKTAKSIMVYLSANGEVKTQDIILNALADGKRLYAPVCGINSSMEAVRFSSLDDLTAGKYGILCPKGSEKAKADEIDLIVVPGCVFGRNMHRIGYGKGYYDRFIRRAKNAKTVGVCFAEGLIFAVPAENYDMPLNFIITENETIGIR